MVIGITFFLSSVSAELNEITAPADGEAAAEVEAGTEAAQVALVLAKRQAPELEANAGCMVYRYGSFSTALDVIGELTCNYCTI